MNPHHLVPPGIDDLGIEVAGKIDSHGISEGDFWSGFGLSVQLFAGGESVAECLAPRDVLVSGEALVDEIECGEQEQRLVRSLVGRAFGERRGADIEVVETFDGGTQEHRR